MPALSKEFLDIQANIVYGSTLKRVRDISRTYRQIVQCFDPNWPKKTFWAPESKVRVLFRFDNFAGFNGFNLFDSWERCLFVKIELRVFDLWFHETFRSKLLKTSFYAPHTKCYNYAILNFFYINLCKTFHKTTPYFQNLIDFPQIYECLFKYLQN